jgi:hypothetical protein
MLQFVHVNGKFPARNPGSFDLEHLI